ncbi:MAG: PepSY domain-containing protein [Gemmatimonadaceae bacterium]|nr:PepSY domain-containing protein [Gemmatimonadaceae bacterium]
MNPQFWRRWHRWIAFPASLFLLWASLTGVVVAGTEFFGEDEALRERTRDLVSPVTTDSPPNAWSDAVQKALTTVAAQGGHAPIDKIELQFKGDAPTVTVFTGKPGGGEDRKFVVNATSGALVSAEAYADKPFVYRLHSGEAFGDGGLVFAMGWGLALAALTVSGFLVFWRMRRRDATGIRKYFF